MIFLKNMASERVLTALHELWAEAPIFTAFAD